MFSFFGKSKTTSCKELANKLASSFVPFTIKMFNEEKTTSGEDSWMAEAGKGDCRTDPLTEWVLFDLFSYINGCRSSMKQDEIHFEFVRCFIAACGHSFIEMGVFSSEREFDQQATERISEYLTTFQNAEVERRPELVGRKFLENAGCNPNDISRSVAAIGYFVSSSINTKKMFDAIQNSYQLTLH